MKDLPFRTRQNVIPIDLDPYLSRLGVYKELPSLNFLRQIHRYHLLTFPFENLDIHHKRPISIDAQRIYKKLIPSRRGGICYELNLLFYHLLVHLGYECHLISARVWNPRQLNYGPEYDHMAILVKLQESIYLCDVGFRNSFISPKKLKDGELQMDANRYFKIVSDPDENLILHRSDNGTTFEKMYKFSRILREPIEFIDMCDFHQSNPKSPLVQKKFMSKLTQYGRIVLSDSELKIVEKGEETKENLLNEDSFYAKMEEHFGISYQSLLQR